MRFTFTVNGVARPVEAPPLRRLLDILREDLRLTGSKEGCGEGECGACAVLLDGRLVDACLVPALQLPGRRVLTIEGLGTAAAPDAMQLAFLVEGAVQCGFCIPGMVMAGHALLESEPRPTRQRVRESLAGNICRCTGYERIFRAVELAADLRAGKGGEAAAGIADAASLAAAAQASEAPAAQASEAPAPVSVGADPAAAFAPASLGEALRLLAEHGSSLVPVAGATDLLVEQKLGRPSPVAVLDLTGLAELREISLTGDRLRIGAAATFADLHAASLVVRHFPAIAAMARQVGSVAIQNRATLGGNLVTASPAADSPPVLIALDAAARLKSSAGERTVPLASFFTGYRQTARRPDELLVAVEVPLASEGSWQAFYKVGTRRAQAIAKVCLGASARRDPGGRLVDVRLAAGSVAPVPLPLRAVEAALVGRELTAATLEAVTDAADAAAAGSVRPIDDVRSTAAYRLDVLVRLVGRFLSEVVHAG
ncbi:MAG: FAD binding domain-containing protein [Candidatus Krumholzibacteriia bacterium]